jgi:hypothetical protein
MEPLVTALSEYLDPPVHRLRRDAGEAGNDTHPASLVSQASLAAHARGSVARCPASRALTASIVGS